MVDHLTQRQNIIDYARTFVGSHYLWGAGGATPGAQDGAWYRPGSVPFARASTDPRHPTIFAAQCDVQGHYVCAGRYQKIPGGREAGREELAKYLAELNEMHPMLWRPYYKYFSPRMIEGSNVDDKGKIVWGEDCLGKRHFDCISFINYVLTATTPTQWSANIEQVFNSTEEVKPGDPSVPGDILFKWSFDKNNVKSWDHIALLAEDDSIVQAQEAVMGVHDDEVYDKGSTATWKARRRLAGWNFTPKPVKATPGIWA